MAPCPPRTSISVCSGAGGLDLGLTQACGVEPVVYIEREAFAAACLVARMEEKRLAPAPVWSDLLTFDASPWRGAVDLVAGGTPCPEFSLANPNRRATPEEQLATERGSLFFHHVRIAEECEAPLFFWENVAGATRVVPRVCEYLEERGYRGAWAIVRASDVGATHSRARVFLLAYSEGFAKREPMADRSRLGRDEGRAESARYGRGPHASERCGEVGRYPPGRADLEGWARVLAVRPDLAPALPQPRLRGVADGLGGRLDTDLRSDRLRLTGNGVVPEQAAHAFRGLWLALFGEE